MTEHSDRMLALIDQGAKDAEAALVDLKALWEREDERIAAKRAEILEAHTQGARDREEARKRWSAESGAVEEVAPVRTSRRASSLPVTPLASLDQRDG